MIMCRSYQRTPILRLIHSRCQVAWRRQGHRKLRREVRWQLRAQWDDDGLLLPLLHELADPWDSPDDGAQMYLSSAAPQRIGTRWRGGVPKHARK